jgi:integrase
VNFYQVFEDYLNHLRIYGKKGSVSQARFHGNKLADHFGMLDPSLLNDRLIDEYVQVKVAQGWGPATVNGSLRILKAMMRMAGYQCKPRMMRVTKKLPTVLTAMEVDRLVAACAPGSDAELGIVIAAHAGLRHREILHLTWGDVSFTDCVLRVTAKPGVDWSPKNHEEREIPFKRGGRLELTLVGRLPVPSPDDAWVFPGHRGLPRSSLQSEIRPAFMRAHLYTREDKPGLHMLRRTWASRMLERGVDINTVRELGGWSNLDILLNYLRSSDEAKRRAVEMVE